eukprot:1161124-Pelagomonas_calceolata.AAC.14
MEHAHLVHQLNEHRQNLCTRGPVLQSPYWGTQKVPITAHPASAGSLQMWASHPVPTLGNSEGAHQLIL